jgi:hypothetical protein
VRFLLCLFFFSCGPAPKCPDYTCGWYNVYDYEITDTTFTSNKIEIDTTGQDIDLELIDEIVDRTEECLLNVVLSTEEAEDGWCYRQIYSPAPIKRNCLLIKIPDDWTMSCDGKEQVLKDKAPFEGCAAKGFDKDPDCPCRWRAAIQDTYVIVITPNLRLLGDPLVKLATGCDAPWNTPQLAACTGISAKISKEKTDEN